MRMFRSVILAVVVGSAFLPRAVTGRFAATAEAAEPAAELGAAAPAAGWVCTGGGTARTGRSDADFIERQPEIVWRRPLPAPPEEEPVTWDEWIFVSSKSAKGGRLLQMIAASDGRVAAKREFATPHPLQMSVSAGVLVVRSGPTKLAAMRCANGQLFDIWNIDLPDSPDSVIAAGRDVFVRTPASISRWRVPSRVPVWTARGLFRGRLAVRWNWVYATVFDDDGNVSVVALAKSTGEIASTTRAGHHNGSTPSPDAIEPIVVVRDKCLVYHALPIPSTSGQSFQVSSSPRSAGVPSRYGAAGLMKIGPGVVESDDGCIVPGTPGDPVTTHDTGGQSSTIVASNENDPEFVHGWDRATAVRGGIYHPAGALRMSDLRICWRFPEAPVGRAVPCGRTLVCVVGTAELIALRAAEPAAAATSAGGGSTAPTAPATPPQAAPGAASSEGRVVLRNGEIRTGPVAVSRDEITTGAGGAAVKVRADRVLAAIANDGRVLFTQDVESLAAAFEEIAAARASVAMGALLQSAARLADPEFLQQFLQIGIERDAPQADIDRVESRVRDLLRPGKMTKADPSAAADLRAKAEALRSEERGAVLEQFRAALPGLTGELRIDAIRWMLRTAPADKGAGDALRALLPPDVQPPAGPKVDAEWADLAAAALRTPIRILKPKRRPPPT